MARKICFEGKVKPKKRKKQEAMKKEIIEEIEAAYWKKFGLKKFRYSKFEREERIVRLAIQKTTEKIIEDIQQSPDKNNVIIKELVKELKQKWRGE